MNEEQGEKEMENVRTVELALLEVFEINRTETQTAISAIILLIIEINLKLNMPLEGFIELTKIMIDNYKDVLKKKRDMGEST